MYLQHWNILLRVGAPLTGASQAVWSWGADGRAAMASDGVRAYNGVQGAQPLAGIQGAESPVGGRGYSGKSEVRKLHFQSGP